MTDWGKLLSTTGSLAETFGAEQPFRYRGYVYDEETGWYYLQSRYYNPELGRFISADVYLSTGQGVIGHNSYAYCGNNPIVRQDPSGYDWWHWLIAGAVVAAAAAIGAVAAVASGVSAATTASTVAAGVFIGSATMLAATAWDAVASSSSIEDVLDAGSWGTVAWTAVGGLVGGFSAYSMTVHTDGPSEPPRQESQCFVAGTAILTLDGSKPIESIKAGDYVYATDPETGESSYKRVVQTFERETDEIVKVTYGGETITTTPTHPFYVPQRGWTEAIKLRAGDILVKNNGEYVVVEKVQHEILETPVIVYNFEVEDYHTYYVAASADSDVFVLVHNKCVEVGSYEIKFKSGKNYVGKGSRVRMQVSARTHEIMYNDPVGSYIWEPSRDSKAAFVDEYFKMAVRGVNNPNTYNIIWSPGRRIFINWISGSGR